MLDQGTHTLGSAIQRINHYQRTSISGTDRLIHWMVIYPMDSVIQLFNNGALVSGKKKCDEKLHSSLLFFEVRDNYSKKDPHEKLLGNNVT